MEAQLKEVMEMDIDDEPEQSTGQEESLSELELLRQQRQQIDEHEAEVRRGISSENPQKQLGENELFVDDKDDSGYESAAVIPIETSGGRFGTTPSDGKDLCFTQRGRAYYVIYQLGPDHGNRVYEARRERSRFNCEKTLGLENLTNLRPRPGTFDIKDIQGVVVAPGCDYKVLLRKNWKVVDKMGVPTPKYPWIQVKVRYLEAGQSKKKSAFFSRSQLGRIFPDSHGIVTPNESVCFNGDVVLEKGTAIEKLDLAILEAYIKNRVDFGKPSERTRSSRSPTVQRYNTPALNATRAGKAGSASSNGQNASAIAFAAPASRTSNLQGASRSVEMTAEEYAALLAYRHSQARPSMRPDVLATTRTNFGAQVKNEDEESEF
ncbi:hypothetical protein IF1G_11401 [Cordyceps javanica]|uniref:Uncharacterized protein n=1 Tax=Cordyceps javanica TaxID=43265 RepID=A0A545VI41_9HYPO|nr:hypothetical protein IF1G_11401 [Cordyceps javanica]TQW01399.1 hypothetical protein IF2G_11079 [Cordyceps javanica]